MVAAALSPTGLKPGAEDGTPGGDSLSGRFGLILGINGDSASDAPPAAAAEVSGEDRVGLGRCCAPRHSSHFTLVYWVEWHPMTWRALSTRPYERARYLGQVAELAKRAGVEAAAAGEEAAMAWLSAGEGRRPTAAAAALFISSLQ